MVDDKWIGTRDGEVIGIFLNRKLAIKYLKELLSQSLEDLKRQDKVDEFNYPINIPKYEFKEIKQRKTFLGLS